MRKNQQDNMYTSLIFVSLIFLVVIGLSIGTKSDATGTLFASSSGHDIIPSAGDLNPNIKSHTMAENIAFGNYQFYFHDPGFSFSGLGVMILGFLSNIFFEGAVLCSKMLTAAINFSMNSTWVASVGTWILGIIGKGSSGFLTTVFYIMMPIGYGTWAIWKGLAQKRYVLAMTGIVGALMLYIVGNIMTTRGPEVLQGMTSTSTKLAQGFMQLGSQTSGGSGGDPIVRINDDIWLTQIYIPWSVNQFGITGIPSDMSNMRDKNGSPKLSILMNSWEQKELKKSIDKDKGIFTAVNITGDWATTLLGPVELNSDERAAVSSVLTDRKNPRVLTGDPIPNRPWSPSPVWTSIATFIMLFINIVQSVMIAIPSLIMIAADIILMLSLIFAHIILAISMVPNYGTKVYKAYLNIIISCFVAKLIYGSVAGLYISSITATYIGVYNMTSGKQFAIIIAGLIAFFINVGFIGLGWLIWKKVGLISIGAFATNVATGDWDNARAQWEESKMRNTASADGWLMNGRLSPYRYLSGNEDFNKYILGANSEQIINNEMNKIKQTSHKNGGELSARDIGKLDDLIDRSQKLQDKSKDSKDFNAFQSMTRRGREFKAEIMQQELEALQKAHSDGDIDNKTYLDQMGVLSTDARDLERNSISSPSVQRAAQNIQNKIMSHRSSIDIGNIEKYKDKLGSYTTAMEDLDQKRSRGGMTDRAYEKQAKEITKLHGIEGEDGEFTAPTQDLYEGFIDNSYTRLMNSAEQTNDDKTYKMLSKAASDVVRFRKDIIDEKLAKTADSHKLDLLVSGIRQDEKIMAIPELAEYVDGIYNSEKIKLLDAEANTINTSGLLDHWKGRIAEQVNGLYGETDHTIVDYARKKVELLEIKDIEDLGSRMLGHGVPISDIELNGLKERTKQALSDYISSGENKERAETVLSKIDATLLIDSLAGRSYQDQSGALTEALSGATSEAFKELLSGRLADVDAGKLKENVLNTISQLSVIAQDADSGAFSPDVLQSKFEDALRAYGMNNLPSADIAKAIEEGNYGNVSNIFTWSVNENLKNAQENTPANNQAMGQVIRRQINTVASIEQDIGFYARRTVNKSEEVMMEDMVKQVTNEYTKQFGESFSKFGQILHDKIASNNISVMDSIVKDMKNIMLQAITGATKEVQAELSTKVAFLDTIIKETDTMVKTAMSKQEEGIREQMRLAAEQDKSAGKKGTKSGGELSDGGVDLS